MKLFNKIAVITGAAGGIGTEITKRFINEGAKVVSVDISTEALGKLSSKMGNPENLLLVKTDISSEESTQELYKQVKDKWNSADIIINNAGWFPFLEFEKMTYADWKKVMSINLDGGFLWRLKPAILYFLPPKLRRLILMAECTAVIKSR